MAFMDDWHQKGIENWESNMNKFKLREQNIVIYFIFRKNSN